jgi:predicted house-cleaning NTP pyrophosphatase (Maf/HAM1 superfamily)
MRTYTLEEIKAYVATGDPLDKAVRTLFKANLSILFGFQHGCFAM